MRTEYSYNMNQVQKLAMTKEMQLSIKILQMSSQELSEYVEKEFVDNPVVEISDNSIVSIKESDFYTYNRKHNVTDDVSPFNFLSEEKSFKDYLHEQILEVEKDEVIRKTADYIVECLDNSGYLNIEEDILVKKLKVNKSIVNEALKLIQSLEPAGVGARTLRECLLIQLKHLKITDSILINVINNNLPDIGNDDYKKIAKDLNITKAEAQRYSNFVRKLEPRPSRGFYTGEDYKYIVPDAQILKVNNGLEIIMNEQSVPKLTINSTYKNFLNDEHSTEVEKYVKDRVGRAEFLIKSIEERKNTLKNILECIVKKQYEYFMGRDKYIKPMMIKDIAEELKCSESTVSRAVKDKYILTSSGIIKIKKLFEVNSIKGREKDVSVNIVKNMIKEIIDEEDKRNPISDQKIVEDLKEKDIQISRRTVAKYREELGIKSSHKRKQL